MKRFSRVMISMILVAAMSFSMAACSDKTNNTTESTPAETTEATTTTTEATTTLTEYSGPLPSSDVSVSWEESALAEEATMYATVSGGQFLRVRSGPGTTYDIKGTLTRGQAVTVVAKTSSGWYKTSDGFYISSQYLSNTEPA